MLKKAIPALAASASVIGDPAVRYRGTIGGSIANNDPAADYPAAVLALGATVMTNKRAIAADDSSRACSRRRWRMARSSPRSPSPCRQGGLCQVPQSGVALRDDGRIRCEGQGGRRACAVTGASQDGVMRVGAIEAALKANWSAAAIDAIKIPDAA